MQFGRGSARLLALAAVAAGVQKLTWRTKLLMKASRPGRKLRSPPCTMRLYEKWGSSTSDTCAGHAQYPVLYEHVTAVPSSL